MIESVRLKNFRKHDDLTVEFDDKFNLIHGRNNAGKSTIFYGIEYGLFGNVQGFKKIAQLAKFDANAVGVQLIFKGKDGERYKLQRMHKLKGKSKSAQGFYTLKKIKEEGEAYLLSSDHGDREEDLMLKISTILGISKRFFETGIHFYQGSVSEILTGDKKLDIVFGIKSAIALADEFKDRALEFEREVKNIEALKATLEQSKTEKGEYQKKLGTQEQQQQTIGEDLKAKEEELQSFQEFKSSSETVSKSVESFETQKRALEDLTLKQEMINKEIKEVSNKFGSKTSLEKTLISSTKALDILKTKVQTSENNLEVIQKEMKELELQKVEQEALKNQKEEFAKDLQTLLEKIGDSQKLNTLITNKEKKTKEIAKEINKLEKESEALTEFFRTIERTKGDVEGILTRREQSKDKPTCEYCGAPIDPSKIAEQIQQYNDQLKKINTDIKANEKKNTENKTKLTKTREQEKELHQELSELKTTSQKVGELESKICSPTLEELNSELKKLTIAIGEQENKLLTERQGVTKFREDEKIEQQKVNEVKAQIERMNELDTKAKEGETQMKKANEYLTTAQTTLTTNMQKVKTQISQKVTQLKKSKDEQQKIFIDSLDTIINKMDGVEQTFEFDQVVIIKEQLKEVIITKITEISTSLAHLTKLKEQMLTEIEETKDHIKRLDRQIATTEKGIESLYVKEKIAKKYRTFQDIYKEVQSIIRENASRALEEKVHILHKTLSTTDEFAHIHIDSDDYSLSVTPIGMDINETYPAALYEGGGHKLMLGLSYKFSLGKIIGNTPFLLIDEPTEFMDVENRVNLLSHLPSIAEDTQILLITHQDVDKIQCDKKIGL